MEGNFCFVFFLEGVEEEKEDERERRRGFCPDCACRCRPSCTRIFPRPCDASKQLTQLALSLPGVPSFFLQPTIHKFANKPRLLDSEAVG